MTTTIKQHLTIFALLLSGLVIAFLMSTFMAPQKAEASYNGARLIDNSVFRDEHAMSVSSIQNFLENMNSGLQSETFVFDCYGADSKERDWYTSIGAPCDEEVKASVIIFYGSKVYGLNPQVVLATLQKEQSLITTTNPTDWQLDWAMGYGCPTSSGCPDGDKAQGFFRQIDYGAWVLRYHYERARGNTTWWNNYEDWTCGTEKNFYKPNLYPQQNVRFYDQDDVHYRTYHLNNAATSSMYCYTPHAYNNPEGLYGLPKYGTKGRYYTGSRNFVTSFNNWFGSTINAKAYAWSLVSQQIFINPERTVKLTGKTTVAPGQELYARIVAENKGSQPWSPAVVRLGTSKSNDRTSPFEDTSWTSSNRPTVMEETEDVSYGQTGTFEFTMTAPNEAGSHKEYFNIVAEGKTWLNDIGLYYPIDVVEPVETPASGTVSLEPGQTIKPGDHVVSADRKSALVLNDSGDLKLYSNFREVWSSNTGGESVARLTMQEDGNLVLRNNSGKAVWHTGTPGYPEAQLHLQTDGNMVIRSKSNSALWWTSTMERPDNLSRVNTSIRGNNTRIYPGQRLETADRKFQLYVQEDGNIVLRLHNKALWNSGTVGQNISYLELQSDGNLVLRDEESKAIWYTGTPGNPNDKLTVQEDGNLVLRSRKGKAIWHTKTFGAE